MIDPTEAIPAPYTPPKAWFEETPDWFDPEGPLIQIDFKTGRVAALVAPYTECILDGSGACWTPPQSKTNYEFAHVGNTLTAEGEQVRTANIGGGINHAHLRANVSVAADHYANTATRKMFGRYRDEPGVGIVFLGSMYPGTTYADALDCMSSALSGDWRYIQSLKDHEMCGSQLVNNPGFRPVPRTASFAVARYACMGPDGGPDGYVMRSHWDMGQPGSSVTIVQRLEALERALMDLLEGSIKDNQLLDGPAEPWELPPPLPYRAATARRVRRAITPSGGGRGRHDYHDPTTGKFAPLGYVSPRILRDLTSNDYRKRRHAELVMKAKFDSPAAKKWVAEYKFADGPKRRHIANKARSEVIADRPTGTSADDRKDQSAWDRASDILASAIDARAKRTDDAVAREWQKDPDLGVPVETGERKPGVWYPMSDKIDGDSRRIKYNEDGSYEVKGAIHDGTKVHYKVDKDGNRTELGGGDLRKALDEYLEERKGLGLDAPESERKDAFDDVMGDPEVRKGLADGAWLFVDKVEDVEDYEDYVDNAISTEDGGDTLAGEALQAEREAEEGARDSIRAVSNRDLVDDAGSERVMSALADYYGERNGDDWDERDRQIRALESEVSKPDLDDDEDLNWARDVDNGLLADFLDDNPEAAAAIRRDREIGRVFEADDIDLFATGDEAGPEEVTREELADAFALQKAIEAGKVIPDGDLSNAELRTIDSVAKRRQSKSDWLEKPGDRKLAEWLSPAGITSDERDRETGIDIPEVEGIPEGDIVDATADEVRAAANERGTVTARIADNRMRTVGLEKGDLIEVSEASNGDAAIKAENKKGKLTTYKVKWERFDGIQKVGDGEDGDDGEGPEPPPEPEVPEVDIEAWRERKRPLVQRVNDGDADAARELADVLDEEAAEWEAAGDADTAQRRRNNAEEMRALASDLDGDAPDDGDDGDDELPEGVGPDGRWLPKDIPSGRDEPNWQPLASLEPGDYIYVEETEANGVKRVRKREVVQVQRSDENTGPNGTPQDVYTVTLAPSGRAEKSRGNRDSKVIAGNGQDRIDVALPDNEPVEPEVVDHGEAAFDQKAFSKWQGVDGADTGLVTTDGEKVFSYVAMTTSSYDTPHTLFVTESGKVLGRAREKNYSLRYEQFDGLNGNRAKFSKTNDDFSQFAESEWVPESPEGLDPKLTTTTNETRLSDRATIPAAPLSMLAPGDTITYNNKGNERRVERIVKTPTGIAVYYRNANGKVAAKPDVYRDGSKLLGIKRNGEWLGQYDPEKLRRQREELNARIARDREWLNAVGLTDEDQQRDFLMFEATMQDFAMFTRELANEFYEGNVDQARARMLRMEKMGLVIHEDVNGEWEKGHMGYDGKKATVVWQAGLKVPGDSGAQQEASRFEAFEVFTELYDGIKLDGDPFRSDFDGPDGWGERTEWMSKERGLPWGDEVDPDLPDGGDGTDLPEVRTPDGYEPEPGGTLDGVPQNVINALDLDDDDLDFRVAEVIDKGQSRYSAHGGSGVNSVLFFDPDSDNEVRVEWYNSEGDGGLFHVTALKNGRAVASADGELSSEELQQVFDKFQNRDPIQRRLSQAILGQLQIQQISTDMALGPDRNIDGDVVNGVMVVPENFSDLNNGWQKYNVTGWRTNAVPVRGVRLIGNDPVDPDSIPRQAYWALEPSDTPGNVELQLVDAESGNILQTANVPFLDPDASLLFSLHVGGQPVEFDQDTIDGLRGFSQADFDGMNAPSREALAGAVQALGHDSWDDFTRYASAGRRQNGDLVISSDKGMLEIRSHSGGDDLVVWTREGSAPRMWEGRPMSDFLTAIRPTGSTDIPESLETVLRETYEDVVSNEPERMASARERFVAALNAEAPPHRWGDQPGIAKAITRFGMHMSDAVRRRDVSTPTEDVSETSKEIEEVRKASSKLFPIFDDEQFRPMLDEMGAESLDDVLQRSIELHESTYGGYYNNSGGEMGKVFGGTFISRDGKARKWAMQLEGQQETRDGENDVSEDGEFMGLKMAIEEPGSQAYSVSLYGDGVVEQRVEGRHLSKAQKLPQAIRRSEKAAKRDRALSGADKPNRTGRSQRQNATAAMQVLTDLGVQMGPSEEGRRSIRAGSGAGIISGRRGWRGDGGRSALQENMGKAQTMDSDRLKKDGQLVDTGLSYYPASWIDSLGDHTFLVTKRSGVDGNTGGLNYNLTTDDFFGRPNASVMAIPTESETGKDTIVHEVGHTMENLVPGLREVLFAHLDSRHDPEDRAKKIGPWSKAYGWENKIARAYGRRVYGHSGGTPSGTWGQARDRDSIRSTEYLTTGMEGLVDTNTDSGQVWGVDPEHDAFILGVLATFEPSGVTPAAGAPAPG